MSQLNALFDVVRGWGLSDKQTIDEAFEMHSSVPGNNPIRQGEFVEVEAPGEVVRADAPDLSGLSDTDALVSALNQIPEFWLVYEGAESNDYSSLKQTGQTPSGGISPTYEGDQIVAIKGTWMAKTEEFVDRSATTGYAAGDALTVVGGKLDVVNSQHNTHHPKVAEVVEFDASQGDAGLLTAVNYDG